MASGYIEHITNDGDRWDSLAWKYYGDPHAYEGIILANPNVPIIPILPAGVRLLIPMMDSSTVTSAPPAGLPPWV
jgi:phage tail protein X